MPHDLVHKIKFLTPSTPKSHPWGMTQATEWKSRLICFISFNCEKTHKVWFKNLWNWLCDWDLMIFYLWPLPRAPGGWDPKNCVVACAIDVSYSHTKSGWISEKNFFLTTQPPTVPPSPTPGAWPRQRNENPVWYDLYLSFVRRHTKFGLKIFEIDFVIEF